MITKYNIIVFCFLFTNYLLIQKNSLFVIDYPKNPKLIIMALSTSLNLLLSNTPILLINRALSIVLICSNNTTESFSKPYVNAFNSICVGNFALLSLLVIAAIITVGLYLLPISFCTIKTGLIPPCSLPTTGDKLA